MDSKKCRITGDVDFDGDGPMKPTKDIKYFLLDLFDVYANCSSIDKIPIQFSDELASPITSADPTKKFRIFAVCSTGQG